METNLQPKQPLKKGPATWLIILLIVLLIGGGLGLYWFLKPKKDAPKKPPEEKTPSGAKGRNVSNYQYKLPPSLVKSLMDQQQKPSAQQGKEGSSPNSPLYINSPQALELIANTAKDLQLNEANMDLIRAKYNIGKPMMGKSSEEQQCIEQLFEQLDNVDLTSNPQRQYLAYPVYGTLEPKGKLYRAELQNILDKGWMGLNLTDLRDSSAPWWCREIGLNLLVGTTWPNTPTTHNVWASLAPRSELNFFKQFNRHWVDDKDLADVCINRHNTQQVVGKNHPDARAAYCATGMYEFVERWVREIDRLDEVTKFAAFQWLQQPDAQGKRWYFTYINPDTKQNEENSADNPFYNFLNTTGKGGATAR